MNMIAGLLSRKYNQIHLIGGFNIEEYNKQKQPSRGVFKKRCSENMQQIYRRTPMPKCDFNKEIALRHGCSPVNLLHTFRTPFLKDIPGRLLPNKRNDKRFNYCSYSLFYFMGIVLKHLWLIPNILRLESSVSLKNLDFFFQIFLFLWKRFLQRKLVVSKFLLEMPKFGEKALICVITFIKVRDLLLALLVIAILK